TKPSDFSAAMRPLVQKILVPFSTQWSPSRTAVAWMAEEPEPHDGSVIAIAAHFGSPPLKRARKRSFCSGVPAAATAAPPRPALGIERERTPSPPANSPHQHDNTAVGP